MGLTLTHGMIPTFWIFASFYRCCSVALVESVGQEGAIGPEGDVFMLTPGLRVVRWLTVSLSICSLSLSSCSVLVCYKRHFSRIVLVCLILPGLLCILVQKRDL